MTNKASVITHLFGYAALDLTWLTLKLSKIKCAQFGDSYPIFCLSSSRLSWHRVLLF